MKYVIVGGNFNSNGGKESSIVKLLAFFHDNEPDSVSLYNGGNFDKLNEALEEIKTIGNDVVIWMPNIENSVEKFYPQKTKGTVLICSKVMRDGYSIGDAISRIFKMNANAVIAIYKTNTGYSFNLVDALGNTWCKSDMIFDLRETIRKLVDWTKNSIRLESKFDTTLDIPESSNLEDFCKLVRKVAEEVEKGRNGRYFGNCSTRCSYMFPSMRDNNKIFVSSRNMPKDFIKPEDMVVATLGDNVVLYNGDKKPSVDTPIQLKLYEYFPNINFFIHGHAIIEGVQIVPLITDEYYPCGDLREFEEIKNIYSTPNHKMVLLNLKNHGFLIGADTLESLESLVKSLLFKYKII